MEGLFAEPASTLFMQLPLAGMVVMVVALFLFYLDKWMKADREAREKESENTRLFLGAQTVQFTNFLHEQGVRYDNGLSRIAEEVKTNTQNIATLSAILQTHDARSSERNINLRQDIQAVK